MGTGQTECRDFRKAIGLGPFEKGDITLDITRCYQFAVRAPGDGMDWQNLPLAQYFDRFWRWQLLLDIPNLDRPVAATRGDIS